MRTIFLLAAIFTLALTAVWLVGVPTVLAGPCNPQQQQC